MDEAHANSICYCGILAALWTSWSNDNLGRRFFGCQNYGDRRYFHFFAWFDNLMSPRARIVIIGRHVETTRCSMLRRALEGVSHQGDVTKNVTMMIPRRSDIQMMLR
ncbi:hypothetical protein PVK06_043142 [Gossypium arboreum]|uniref:GRF-type domain-containing protein n=1 Tax=Gossypium arboreum TaxID=29729 RepID=A0ABR0MMQ2_GOSAR|nr:hypothetical protein PVK06_043142 [Gossypium arboreum]